MTIQDQMNAIHWKLTGLQGATLKDDGKAIKYVEWPDKTPKPTQEQINSWTAEFLASNEHASRQFNPDIVLPRMTEVFSPDRMVMLAPYAFAIKTFLDFKNMAGLKAFVTVLVAGKIATADDLLKLKMILTEQNIDLDKF